MNRNNDGTNKAKHQLWKLQKQKRFLVGKMFGSFNSINATKRSSNEHIDIRNAHTVRTHNFLVFSTKLLCVDTIKHLILNLFHSSIAWLHIFIYLFRRLGFWIFFFLSFARFSHPVPAQTGKKKNNNKNSLILSQIKQQTELNNCTFYAQYRGPAFHCDTLKYG